MFHHFLLFNSQDPGAGCFYGDYFKKHFLDVFVKEYPGPALLTFGDLILSGNPFNLTRVNLSDKLSEFRYEPNYKKTIQLINHLFKYIEKVPSSIYPHDNWRDYTNAGVFILGISSRQKPKIEKIENELRKGLSGYLGFFEFSENDPFIYRIFFTSLFDNVVLDDGCLYHGVHDLTEPWSSYVDEEVLKKMNIKTSCIRLSEFERKYGYLKEVPSKNYGDSYKLKYILDVDISQRIMRASINGVAVDGNLVFDARAYNDLNQLQVDEKKLRDYVLNNEHEVGKHKAKLFNELLGVDQEDWKYLLNEISRSIPTMKVLKVKSSEYGIKFEATLEVVGKNNKSKTLFSAWIIKSGESPRLITLYVARKSMQKEGGENSSLLISSGSNLKENFKNILKLAHRYAYMESKKVVPAPVIRFDIFGNEKICEKGMAGKVLIKICRINYPEFTNYLYSLYKDSYFEANTYTVCFTLPEQPLDEASAFAKAFCDVLKVNGIEVNLEVIEY